MRTITIIGGGQSGLQLGIGLLQAGHKVRVVQNRTAEDIATGKVLSSQCMFHTAVQNERDLGIDFWSDICPRLRASTSWSRTLRCRVPRRWIGSGDWITTPIRWTNGSRSRAGWPNSPGWAAIW
ncbi:hypothetical protein ACFSHQ_06235 [Gemmobacter lanyuensis]